jgi:hypothetical protein
MAVRPERRRVVRLSVPWHLSGPGAERQEVRLIDLSPEGVRIEHFEPVRDWSLCVLDLPPALGGARLMGEVVWSRMGGRKQVTEGQWRVYYRSGLAFRGLTDAQRTALARALETLRAAREAPEGEPSR